MACGDEASGPMVTAEELARLQAELDAARRTIATLIARIEREEAQVRPADPTSPDFRQTIRELETTVAARTRDLVAREAYYRALHHQSPDAILTLSGDKVVGCNRTAEAIFGLGADELVGREVSRLLSVESGAALMGLLWSGFVGVGDAELEVPSGRRLAFSVARLSDDRVLLVLRDVTQRRRLEEQLERVRLQVGLGQLAAELASEITGSLSVVAGRVQLLRQRPPQDPEALRGSLDVIAEHCRNIDAIVENLRALGRPRAPRPAILDARELAEAAVEAEAGRLRRVQLVVDLPEEQPVRVDRPHAVLILRNLLAYLAEHMPLRRELRVRGGGAADPNRLRLLAEGLVLPDEVQEVLRAPRGDQAALGSGHGLSLAIALVLAAETGGRIGLSADGAEVIYQLGPSRDVPLRLGPGSVLVVDDDQLLCDTVTWMLSGIGYRVQTASSAEEALRVLAGQQFDCILADLILPGMHGIDLLLTARQRWPDRKTHLVLTTGAQAVVPDGIELLPKPFDRAQLVAAVGGRHGAG